MRPIAPSKPALSLEGACLSRLYRDQRGDHTELNAIAPMAPNGATSGAMKEVKWPLAAKVGCSAFGCKFHLHFLRVAHRGRAQAQAQSTPACPRPSYG